MAAPKTPKLAAIRAARDDDGPGLIALIGACFAEYPGCILDVDGEMPELRGIASAYAAEQGRFLVAERAGLLVASVGWAPAAAGAGIELRKLYVARSARRQGLAGRLCERVEDAARERSDAFVELWSDTRFGDAHRLYESRDYQRGEQQRELHDRSFSVEYHYRLALAPAPV